MPISQGPRADRKARGLTEALSHRLRPRQLGLHRRPGEHAARAVSRADHERARLAAQLLSILARRDHQSHASLQELSDVLADFKNSSTQVLVATDLAARGLDIVQLPAVVNYDLPRSAIDYSHRIGRTGRAGEVGGAVSFITAENHAHFQLIEKRQHQTIPREEISGFEPKEIALPPSHGTGGIKGRHKNKKDKLREAAAQE